MRVIRAIAAVALVTATAAIGQTSNDFTVKVLDRQKKPVPSAIFVQVNDAWVAAGQTNKAGTLRTSRRCDGALPVRADPLDHTYFPSTPRFCSKELVITVRERGDPIYARLDEFDHDKDGKLTENEFIELMAAAAPLDSDAGIYPVEYPRTTASGSAGLAAAAGAIASYDPMLAQSLSVLNSSSGSSSKKVLRWPVDKDSQETRTELGLSVFLILDIDDDWRLDADELTSLIVVPTRGE